MVVVLDSSTFYVLLHGMRKHAHMYVRDRDASGVLDIQPGCAGLYVTKANT